MEHLIGLNSFPLSQLVARRGADWWSQIDPTLEMVRVAGVQAFEPSIPEPSHLEQLVPVMHRHGLALRSVYIPLELHGRPEDAAASLAAARATAQIAQEQGARFAVLNCDPINWNEPVDKDDAQLAQQADHLHALCDTLVALKMRGVLHVHTSELRCGAREMVCMMASVPADRLGLCADWQWFHRGCGQSQRAAEAWTTLFADRIDHVHLRQSRDGAWAWDLEPGDLDFSRLVDLLPQGARPEIVLEPAMERDAEPPADPVESLRAMAQRARHLFPYLSAGS